MVNTVVLSVVKTGKSCSSRKNLVKIDILDDLHSVRPGGLPPKPETKPDAKRQIIRRAVPQIGPR